MKIVINGYEHAIDMFKFPAGEVGLNIKNSAWPVEPSVVDLKVKLRNSDDVMAMLLAKNAIDEYFNQYSIVKPDATLIVAYVPYARQDRVANKGEPLSIKVMCDLINYMNFNNVTIYDPHSDVTSSLINNCKIVTQEMILSNDFDLSNKLRSGNYTIVAPDAGSQKKAFNVAKYFGCEMISASKHRDTKTGRITDFKLLDDVDRDMNYIIIDDICDGGGTFIPLAQLLRSESNQVELYTTHGVYSKGVDNLLGVFNVLYTTDSYHEDQSDDRVITIKL